VQYKWDRRLSPHNMSERISALAALDMASKMAKRIRGRLEKPVPPTPSQVADVLAECRSSLVSAIQHLEAVQETTEEGAGIRFEATFSVGSENPVGSP
jgi:hypothetical protein